MTVMSSPYCTHGGNCGEYGPQVLPFRPVPKVTETSYCDSKIWKSSPFVPHHLSLASVLNRYYSKKKLEKKKIGVI